MTDPKIVPRPISGYPFAMLDTATTISGRLRSAETRIRPIAECVIASAFARWAIESVSQSAPFTIKAMPAMPITVLIRISIIMISSLAPYDQRSYSSARLLLTIPFNQ
jgi:hypothetical protein